MTLLETNMVRTQIQLTEKQAKALKKLALSRHLSVAEIIRDAVDTIIKSNAIVDDEERKERAIAIAGRFRSGKHNISQEHDKYLAETLNE